MKRGGGGGVRVVVDRVCGGKEVRSSANLDIDKNDDASVDAAVDTETKIEGFSVGFSEIRASFADWILRVIGGSDFWRGWWIGSQKYS